MKTILFIASMLISGLVMANGDTFYCSGHIIDTDVPQSQIVKLCGAPNNIYTDVWGQVTLVYNINNVNYSVTCDKQNCFDITRNS